MMAPRVRTTAAERESYLDSYADSERWLLAQADQTLWISHWVLLEVAGVMASCVRRGQLTAQRLSLIHI